MIQCSRILQCSVRSTLSKYTKILFRTFALNINNLANEIEMKKPNVNTKTIKKIKKLSLIDIEDECGMRILNEAIKFAEYLDTIKIKNEVEPLYSTLEWEPIPLRNDDVCNTNKDDILTNAAITEEEYFVAPLDQMIKKTKI